MNALALYTIFLVFLIGLSLAMAYNYLRFRFAGDRTPIFLTVFALLFLANVIVTLAMLRYGSLNPSLVFP